VRAQIPLQVSQELQALGWADTPANEDRVEGILGRRIILAHPLRYLYIHLKDDLNGLLPDVTGPTEILGLTTGGKGTLSILNHAGILAAIRNYYGSDLGILWISLPIVLLLGLVYLLDLCGLVGLGLQRSWLAAFTLLAPTIYYLLIPGAASLPRFRVPVMPYLCLLSAFGVELLLQLVSRRMQNSG
jgi:hypothetical protein